MVTLEPSFTVKVVGDEKLYSESLCKEVHIKCQGIELLADFHILPIGGVRWFWG